MNSVAPRTFRVLDGLRGIAALLIVTRHTNSFFAPIAFQEDYLAVDLFFVMSGVVICHSYENRLLGGLSPWAFAWIRIVRLYPLYLLGCAIGALTLAATGAVGGAQLATFIGFALLLAPNGGGDAYPLDGPSWSLSFELLANLFYGWLCRRLTTRVLVMLALVSAAMLLPIILSTPRHSIDFGFSRRSFPAGLFRVTFSFFAGVILYRQYRSRVSVVAGWRANAAGWGLLAVVLVLMVAAPSAAVQPWYDWGVVVAVFPAVVYVALRFALSGITDRLFRLLGVTSYAVYVLHEPLGRAVAAIAGDRAAALAPWSGLAFLAVLLPLCVLLDQWFDAPVRRRLLRLVGTRSARSVSAAS